MWLASPSAQAQDSVSAPAERPWIPASSVAAEQSAGLAWVNPALGSYDPDFRWSFQGTVYPEVSSLEPQTDLAIALGARGASLGLRHIAPLDGTPGHTALSYGSGLLLGEGIAAGLLLDWQLPDAQRQGRLLADLGLSWRQRMLGAGLVLQNLGATGATTNLRLRAGIAVHPSRALTVALDGWATDVPGTTNFLPGGQLSLRVRPTSGLYLRAGASLDSDRSFSAFAGVEIDLGGVGAQVAASSDLQGSTSVQLAVVSAERDDHLLGGPRRQVAMRLSAPPPEQPPVPLLGPGQRSWLDVLRRLETLTTDHRVEAVTIRLDPHPGWSWARCEELRTRIQALVGAGKTVHVYAHGNVSTKAAYIGSSASQFSMHPAGQLDLIGLSAELTYIAGTLDLLDAEAQFVRRSEYKSAVEQYTATAPSGPSLEQLDALLDHHHAALVGALSDGRGVEPNVAAAWVDEGPFTPEQALQAGLVDALLYPDQLEDHVQGDRKLVEVSLPAPAALGWQPRRAVAVIQVEGVINSGGSSGGGLLGLPRTAGARTISKHLERAREDKRVVAVVLRVDSPGGSAFASEEIWRQVVRVQEAGKPVVVSMGGVAASGGYYVAAPADAIFAEPSTITGSIGVFAGKVATSGVLEKIGISSTTVKRGRNADLYSATQSWDPGQVADMQALVDDMYLRFKSRVAMGRGLSEAEVEEVARGRVWTGTAALKAGLVDEMGGLLEAIAHARTLAEIKGRVDVVTYTPPLDPLGAAAGAVLRAALPIPDQMLSELAWQPKPIVQLPDQLDPLLSWSLAPGASVWMMAPWVVEADGR